MIEESIVVVRPPTQAEGPAGYLIEMSRMPGLV
jgi:hypothetical protein